MTNNTTPKPIDLANIQGLIVRGYNMDYVRYFVLQVTDATKAKIFISDLVNSESLKITSAENWGCEKPDYCLNIGFTFEGLKALKLKDNVDVDITEFENYQPFKEGSIERASRIGDIGESDPEHWIKELQSKETVHILLFLFVKDQTTLDSKSEELRQKLEERSIKELVCIDGAKLRDEHDNPTDIVHFGYRDGIAQPRVAGFPEKKGISDDGQPVIPPYEFVLIDAKQPPYPPYKVAEPVVLWEYGSFAAFRVLKQNVSSFEKFLQDQKAVIDPQTLAAKMCGRWRNGKPLDLYPIDDQTVPITEVELNKFDYLEDPDGFRCPVGSHIRRTNPRKSPIIGNPDSRRLIRRGIPYGPVYDPNSTDPIIANPDQERGLLGLFICSSLKEQFEFVMKDWVNSSSFSTHLDNDSKDPLLGANDPQDSKFDIPLSPPPDKKSLEIKGFERFIITRGGAYCFLPSITALKYMVNG